MGNNREFQAAAILLQQTQRAVDDDEQRIRLKKTQEICFKVSCEYVHT
jgi:hypothetical protein